MKPDSDSVFMHRALVLAKKGEGWVSPNPMVGCLVVRAGKVLAEGWHKVYGGDHAEVVALSKAGDRTRGATLYVTLEPCAHHGQTPPCVDAVIAAGFRRVVVAMTDPNPLTHGRSVQKMRRAGIEVVTGVREAEARELNRAFIKYITRRMPYVVAKTAQTLDGRIATRTGDSRWITSAAARAAARQERNTVDAILVGVGTVLADDPSLDAPGKRIVKLVLDSRARTPVRARLFHGTLPGQVTVVVTAAAPATRVAALRRRGAQVLVCPARRGRVDMARLFKILAQRHLARILVEGGGEVIGSALRAGLVDEWRVYIAPKLIGDVRARPSVAGLDIVRMARAPGLEIAALERVGADILVRAYVHGHC